MSTFSKLHQAVLDSDLLKLKRLLSRRGCNLESLARWPVNKFLGTPMHFAVVKGNVVIAEVLLSAGAKINSEGTLQSPLHWAARLGGEKVVTWLLEHGANVLNKTELGAVPLQCAAAGGNVVVADVLLSQGGNINYQDDIGWTALHCAANWGHTNMALWLLDNGAEVQMRTFVGTTALHRAAKKGHAAVGEILLSKCVDVNLQDNDGWTPLHDAVYYGQNKMVQWLLDNGADVQIKTSKGATALDLAVRRRRLEAAHLIQSSISDESAVSHDQADASSIMSIDQPYNITHYRGVAVIINNQNFSASGGMLPNREGSQYDKETLNLVLRVLGFDVHCFDNLTAYKMLNCLSHYSGINHAQHTCFMCCILTHGSEGRICGVDGNYITPLQVTSEFLAAKCPSLKGKPKAFIIVACKKSDETLFTLHEKDMVPLGEEDFLVAFSTVPDRVSYRSHQFGTPYIKCFAKNISKYGGEKCLSEILRNTEKHLLDEVEQVCCKMDTLRRPFILSGAERLERCDVLGINTIWRPES